MTVEVGPIFAPGSAPPVVLSSVKSDLPPKPDMDAIVRAFKTRLADYRLPDSVINAYATTFYHNGKFILVRTDTKRAEQVMEILRGCGASRVVRHD
jgi:hypothetical protein